MKIPTSGAACEVHAAGRTVRLSNLAKPFWPKLGLTKAHLLQYYADIAPALLPHLHDRAMIMKRYPHGADGAFFFMKRAPSPRPEWIELCEITHSSGNIIDFPMIQDLASLLWVVNLGCIDLNQWYARCDDVQLPDYLHFDLDPVPGASFDTVRKTALIVRDALDSLRMPIEVQYDHFSGGRFRHGTRLLRWRPDKAPEQCTVTQLGRGRGSSLKLLEDPE